MDKIDSIKQKIVKSPDLNSSKAAQLAIRDVSMLLGYCYSNFDDIVDMDDPLDKLFEQIIKSGSLDSGIHISGVGDDYERKTGS